MVQLWNAIAAGAEVSAAVPLEAPRTLAVWRKGLLPHFQTLEPGQDAFLTCLAAGRSIAQACEELQAMPELGQPETLGNWLRAWWDEGLLRSDPLPAATDARSAESALTS